MENVTVTVEDNRRRIVLSADGHTAGEMGILVSNGVLTVYHTEVKEIYSGLGYAQLLLDKLVGFARENNLKITPLCPYVHAQFKRHPDQYNDVWFKAKG